MLSSLEQSILAALVYFDMFDYPLTWLEIHRYLLSAGEEREPRQYTLGEVQTALATSGALQKVVRFKNGFFYLRGRERVLRTRAERLVSAVNKYRRVQRIARLLSLVPFVRLIAVCNSLSYANARAESDIDLFVVTSRGGVWWARGLVLLVLKILRLRPGQDGIRNKICLSFFVDEEHLNLEPLQVNRQDVYLPIWLATLYPLYDHRGYYQKLIRANSWLSEYLPNCRPLMAHPRRLNSAGWMGKIVFEAMLWPFSWLASVLQQRAFPAEITRLLNQDTRVRVEPGLLKFHTNDRRLSYAQEFFKRFKAISSGLA